MTAVLQSPTTPQLNLLSSASSSEQVEEGRSGGGRRGEGSSVEGHRKGRRRGGRERREEEEEEEEKREVVEAQQLSLFDLLLTLLRRSLVRSCTTETEDDSRSMDIGWPTEVRHVAHVTFDRFQGFLGLPSEFQTDVSTAAPSASTTVFGVSTESMQCSYDSRGNSVPTILLLMQRRLYVQGGLQAEGIFRITADNTQEEHVRDQLNHGIVPQNIDVHCLAGLIKAWFRELPNGVLDVLTPEQVMQCQTEEDYIHLLSLLPPTESALLDWAVNLMADVVLEERYNKMNAHNVATVFAPNMTQMGDPLNALMHAVQVMNFLKTLIMKTLRERGGSIADDGSSASEFESSDWSDHCGPSMLRVEAADQEETKQTFVGVEPFLENSSDLSSNNSHGNGVLCTSHTAFTSRGSGCSTFGHPRDVPVEVNLSTHSENLVISNMDQKMGVQSSSNLIAMQPQKNSNGQQPSSQVPLVGEKAKGILPHISSRAERVEAWR